MKYTGEIHFAHTNLETNESAVLGIFTQSKNEMAHTRKRSSDIYNTGNKISAEWRRYLTAAKNLEMTNNSTIISLNLASLMGTNLNDFWRYKGSLTTPPCTEGIIWSVFRTPIVFTGNEITAFRKNIFVELYREPQPLYDRIVYRNFLNETISSISDYKCCSEGSNSSANKLFLLITIIYSLHCFLIK
jgi:carbonic anhydrase